MAGMFPAAAATVPDIAPAELIHWGPSQQVIEVEFNGTMAHVADWDDDGVKDLLVGVYQEGAIYFYHNSGTNAAPVFEEREKVQADGVPINVPYG
jgi:hypothetical protein